MAQLTMVVLGKIVIAWASGAMTILVLIFGEITPKTVARRHAGRGALPVLLLLRVVHIALHPVTWVFVRIAQLALRLAGSELTGGQDVSEAELRAMIDLARREGVLDATRARCLQAVFEMDDRQVRAIMGAQPDIHALDLEDSPEELVRRADGSGHSRLPVHRGDVDEILGVLHSKDLLHVFASKDERFSTRRLQLLLRQPIFVPEAMRLESLLATLRVSRQQLAVVLDEFGGTAGVVTLEDVLEELVGEIRDELDDSDDEPALVPAGPQRWTAPGRLPLIELERRLGLEVPKEGDYETLGGLITVLAGKVPEPGDVPDWQGWRFRVLIGDERRTGLVRVERRATEDLTPLA